MRPALFRVVLHSSVLVAALACNAVRPLRLIAAPATQPAPVVAPHLDANFHVDIRKSVAFLASDELEGRMIGTPGIEQAADYIAGTFSKLGLQPLPTFEGYFQPFKMITRVEPDPGRTSLALGERSLVMGQEFEPLRMSSEGQAHGPVVFAGYGISDNDRHYNDYAALDVKGRIVLMMRYEPHDSSGKSRFGDKDDEWSQDATIPQKIRTASSRGAVAVILVNPAMYHADEGLIAFSRRYPFGADVPVVQVSIEEADRMLKLSGAPDLKTLQSRIDQSLKPQSMPLKGMTARISVGMRRIEKRVENVAAVIPGAGPHADEYVVVGAHYDHLGHGGPGSLAPWSNGIHHGADDNASGTTVMMELADRFAHSGPQERSIIFIAFTAEEEGLIGSEYFVNHCPVPLNKIVAMLNLDMVGRVSNEKLLIGGEGTAENFKGLVDKADEGLPLKLGQFGQGGIGPSDHTSFALKKIPVLFFFSGMHLDYHRPTDTAGKINYHGMDEVAELGERLVKALCAMPREQYVSSFDAKGLLQMNGPSGSGSHSGTRASLGAIPDYAQGEDARGGMRIGGIMPDSPADRAGLHEGDVISRFNDTKIDNMMDYTAALGKAKPGQKVLLKVMRDGKPIDIEATATLRKD